MLIYTIYAIVHNGLHAHLFMGVLKIWKISNQTFSSEKLATNDFLFIVFESVFGVFALSSFPVPSMKSEKMENVI